ncbi:MAG: hypothetical protein ABSH32_03150 [Bryobacteraceae bacterium]
MPDLSNVHFLERGLYWSTFAYIVCVCLAATASLLVALFAARVSFVKNAEIKRLQVTSAEVVAQANAGAARATAQAALSLEELKRLETVVAGSQVHREQLQKQNLGLQSEVEKERTARLRLEEQLAPRRIRAGQRKAIVSALAAFKGQKASIVVHPGDPEIAAFAEQIKAALEQAGIVVSLAPALVFGKPQPGITLEVGAHRRQFATALAKAFVEAGVTTGPISATESETGDFLEITVGPKP